MNVQVGWSLFTSFKDISAMARWAASRQSMQSRSSAPWTVTGWAAVIGHNQLKRTRNQQSLIWLLFLRMEWLISGSMSWPSACWSKVQLWRSCVGRLSSMTKTAMEPLQERKCWRSCRCVCVQSQTCWDLPHVRLQLPHEMMHLLFVPFCSQAVYKMNVAAALIKPNPLTAEECTNRIFVRLDKDNNGEEMIFVSLSALR